MREVVTKTPQETYRLAERMGRVLYGACTIALEGNLGAGKTVFVQGLAAGLGIEAPIVSPTFNIVRQYQGRLPLNHFDVYRIEDPEELREIGFSEYLGDGQVTVIEWADRIAELLPEQIMRIQIQGAGEAPRRILFHGADSLFREVGK